MWSCVDAYINTCTCAWYMCVGVHYVCGYIYYVNTCVLYIYYERSCVCYIYYLHGYIVVWVCWAHAQVGAGGSSCEGGGDHMARWAIGQRGRGFMLRTQVCEVLRDLARSWFTHDADLVFLSSHGVLSSQMVRWKVLVSNKKLLSVLNVYWNFDDLFQKLEDLFSKMEIPRVAAYLIV